MTKMRSITILMASFNRCEQTISSLESIYSQTKLANVTLEVSLVDDASTDETINEVTVHYPKVVITTGNGELFWGGGMRLAQEIAIQNSKPDYILWLNNDVLLFQDSIHELLVRNNNSTCVVVGTVVNPNTGEITYGGYTRSGGPLAIKLANETASDSIDTFNGNVVLIPREVYEAIGAVDASFPHQYGDLDYGYRIKKAGYEILASKRPVGFCAPNSTFGTWEDKRISKLNRIRLIHSKKYMPLNVRVRFCKRHGGRAWIIYVVSGYLKTYFKIFLGG